MITKEEVLDIQKQWSDGLLKIVAKHQENQDYRTEASNFIDKLYAYDSFKVLFKPTLASDTQFRDTKESALSYFIGANFNFREDKGFALKGWESVSWENAGIQISTITGSEINKEIMQIMHRFYEQHCERWGVWGSKYLSDSFFEELANAEHKDQVVLFSAHRGNSEDPLAMSLCIKDANMLWGRYWGSKEEINSLHFEVCYYSPISWALEQGISHFDPGAGGSHKLRRGFIAQSSISLHRWYNLEMDNNIRNWLSKVNKIMLEDIESTNNQLPFECERPELSYKS